MLGGIGAAIGVGALVGWVLDAGPLTMLLAGSEEPRPIAALALVLVGLALAMAPRAPVVRATLAIVAALAGLANVVEHLTGLDLWIDRALLLGRAPGPGVAHPGRMAALTAVSVVLLGASVALSVHPRRAGASQALAILGVFPAVASGLTYLLFGLLGDGTGPRGQETFLPIAMQPVASLVALGAGALIARPDAGWVALAFAEGEAGQSARRLLPAAAFVPFAIGTLGHLGEPLGLYDHVFGTAIQIAGAASAVGAAVLWNASRLAIAHRRVARATDSDLVGVLFGRDDGTVRWANDAWLRMIGRTREELPAVRWDRLGAEDTAIVREAAEQLRRTGRAGPYERVYVRPDGTRLPVLVTVSRHADTGENIAFAFDLTPLKREEAARREAQRRLEESARALELQNRDLQAFARLAAHDLREPIRKVRLFADRLALEEPLGAPGRVLLDRIAAAAVRLDEDLEAILAYSTLALGDMEPVDLGAVVREEVDALAERFAACGATVEISGNARPCGDRRLLGLLVRSLLQNALTFRSPERPLVVRVELGTSGDDSTLVVRDNGIGFQPAQAERIFGVFARLHARGAFPGQGMGLPTCRKIAELHGGSASAEGALGVGATFRVTVPRACDERHPGRDRL